jgi:hypothetical protein
MEIDESTFASTSKKVKLKRAKQRGSCFKANEKSTSAFNIGSHKALSDFNCIFNGFDVSKWNLIALHYKVK